MDDFIAFAMTVISNILVTYAKHILISISYSSFIHGNKTNFVYSNAEYLDSMSKLKAAHKEYMFP